jgi:hypothetical protein
MADVVTREEFRTTIKRLNNLLKVMIERQEGVATSGILVPSAPPDNAWLKNVAQLIKRSRGRKPDIVVIYSHPQFVVKTNHFKSE